MCYRIIIYNYFFYLLQIASSLLQDSRFSSMFTNPDFQVDPESEEYRLLNPVVSKLDKTLRKKQEREALKQFTEVEVIPCYVCYDYIYQEGYVFTIACWQHLIKL